LKKIHNPDGEWTTDDDVEEGEEEEAAVGEEEEGEEEGESSDEHGDIDVPARDKFFFVLNKLGLFATSSRRNDLTKT